jgi:hypothetical protein
VTDPRRFPPPWSVEGTDACFIIRDYVYFEEEPGRRAAAKHPAAVAVCHRRYDFSSMPTARRFALDDRGDERRLLHRARQERPGLIHEPYSGLGA